MIDPNLVDKHALEDLIIEGDNYWSGHKKEFVCLTTLTCFLVLL